MREVVPGLLWLGNSMDAGDLRRLLDIEINAIVDLTIEETPPHLTRELIYCRFPLNDGAGNPAHLLRGAVQVVMFFLEMEVRTFVYCGAGMSRSPCVVAMAMALRGNTSPDDMLMNLLTGHPHDVSPPVWADVKKACARSG